MKFRYWLSFDLGLRGNYEDLYEWLDNLGAKECGETVATFITEKTFKQMAKELSRFLDEKARIYIISRHDGKFGGKFFLGRRKRAPWAGYGGPVFEVEEETEE